MKDELEKGNIKIVNQNGEELVCDILFTFDSDETKKSYIVYTANDLDENGQLITFASTYDPSGEDLALGEITTKKEYDTIQTILGNLQNKIKETFDEGDSSNEESDRV